MYQNSIERIFIPEEFKEIASHSNNIQGYSFINRALIHIQNRFCTDVRSRESWEVAGRTISDRAVPLGIITKIEEVHYIDTENSEEVNREDFSADEFVKALRLGLIEKRTDITNIKCRLVYDESDTKIIVDSQETERRQRKLKLSALYQILSEFGIVVIKAEDNVTSFDNDNATLKVGSENLQERLKIICDAISSISIGMSGSSIDFNLDILGLASKYILYAICTYYGVSCTVDFSNSSEVYQQLYNIKSVDDQVSAVDEFINVLDTSEFIINQYLFGRDSGGIDAESQTNKIKRAGKLLDILEASYEAYKFRGGPT